MYVKVVRAVSSILSTRSLKISIMSLWSIIFIAFSNVIIFWSSDDSRSINVETMFGMHPCNGWNLSSTIYTVLVFMNISTNLLVLCLNVITNVGHNSSSASCINRACISSTTMPGWRYSKIAMADCCISLLLKPFKFSLIFESASPINR